MAIKKSPLIAEALGTFLLIFTVGCNVLGGGSGALAVVSIAAVLMTIVYSLGPVSGANVNPAVSFGLVLAGKLSLQDAATYVVAQLIGAGVSVVGLKFLYGKGVAGFGLEGDKDMCAVLASEAFFTFLLVFVVLNVATTGKNQYFGLAIGSVILSGGYSVGAISGGAFNPAVAIALDFSDMKHIESCLFYTLAELGGAGVAAGLFKVVRDPQNKFRNPICEFLGTFFLVFSVGLNVNQGAGHAYAVLSIAATLMVMIYALGPVSGGHFNPAVTMAIATAGRNKIDKKDVPLYIAAQIVGGICGALSYSFIINKQSFPLSPAGGWVQVAIAEGVFTFLLAYVVLCVATTKDSLADMFGLAIASCVVVGGYAVGNISGGAFNPAVAIGIDVSYLLHGGGFSINAGIYTAIEIAAGAAAGVFFKLTHPLEYGKTD